MRNETGSSKLTTCNFSKKAKDSIDNIDKNSDTEYLHTFRVSLRRARSLMHLFFPHEKKLQKALKSAMKRTNKLREIDVLLHSLQNYPCNALYKKLQSDKEQLYKKIWTKKLSHSLHVKLADIIKELSEGKYDLSKKYFKEQAKKFYVKTMKKHKKIQKKIPSEKELHKLRVLFKTARYSLEVFPKKQEDKIEKCEHIQSHLGTIQDLKNQIDFLQKYVKKEFGQEINTIILEKNEKLQQAKQHLCAEYKNHLL